MWAATQLNSRDNENEIGGVYRLRPTDGVGVRHNYTDLDEQYWDGHKPFLIIPTEGNEGHRLMFRSSDDFLLEDNTSVVPNAAIKFDNLYLDAEHLALGKEQNFFARGNKMVMGRGIHTKAEDSDYVFRIYGGTEHNRDYICPSEGCGRPNIPTNVVIAGGKWNYAFGGGEGATGTGTQVTVRDAAEVANLYGGGERKGSVGVNEPMVNGTRANPNNPGVNVHVEGGQVGTLYGGSAINGDGLFTDTHALVINEDIHVNVSGGYVGRIFGGDDTHDKNGERSGVKPVERDVLMQSPINGDVFINLSGENVAGQVVGDINRNRERAIGDFHQVQGATTLNIAADQNLDRMELLDFVNIDGATVHMNNEIGFGPLGDADYPTAEGYLGNIAVTNGGRLELAKRGIINDNYWQTSSIEQDMDIQASPNHEAVHLRHGWTGEPNEADRARSVLAIAGHSAGITAASGTAFDDSSAVAGLLIHGSVAGYSTLEVTDEPIYSDATNYYYHVVADGSSGAPASANGGAAFKEPEGANYVVLYRELEGGKIGWYLRERPTVTMGNFLAHAGDAAPVTAHVDMKGFAYEWANDPSSRVKIAATKHAGAASATDSDMSISAADLAGIATDSRFTNVTYDSAGNLTSFDVVLDSSAATEPAYYEVAIEFAEGDDIRTGATANCARVVYDIVDTTEASDSDYQNSIMKTAARPGMSQEPPSAAGKDKARIVVQMPYGVSAGSLTIAENDGSFTMTDENGTTQRTASLADVATIVAGYETADENTANTSFGIAIGESDLSSVVSIDGVSGVAAYDTTVYSYKNQTVSQISNVHQPIVQRDAANGITGGIGEVTGTGTADGIVLNFGLNSLTYGGNAVGADNPTATNYGELRIRTIPPINVVPTGTAWDTAPWTALALGTTLIGGAWIALTARNRRHRLFDADEVA